MCVCVYVFTLDLESKDISGKDFKLKGHFTQKYKSSWVVSETTDA